MGKQSLEIHYDGEWAALYVDGTLDENSVGDTHVAEERAFAMLGVKQIYDESFLRGGNDRSDAAKTLGEIAAYRAERDARLAKAGDLRRQAARLLDRAAQVEKRP
jgi:hypothetical protein